MERLLGGGGRAAGCRERVLECGRMVKEMLGCVGMDGEAVRRGGGVAEG